DFSFAGPTRPLQFTRTYSSGRTARSFLGTAWHHNWDQRIVPMRRGEEPGWAALYCHGWNGLDSTCVMYVDGKGREHLFIYDSGTGLYLPRAGGTDTIARTGGAEVGSSER